MSLGAVYQAPVPVNDDGSGKTPLQLALEVNACRVLYVAEQLIMCSQSSDNPEKVHHLCLALSSYLDDMVDEALRHNQEFHGGNSPHALRGIDYGLANNEVPAHASKLPPVLKEVCSRKDEFFLQASIMVLMISVKNACKLGWFSPTDTEELLALADEVASFFVTKKDINTDVGSFLPTVSTIMSRFYPRFKLGHIITSLEVKPGYGTHLIDFHISKDIVLSKEEKIYLFVAMKDNINTSSCIVTPRQVNILLNGNAVDHRNNPATDHGPQLPTIVNRSLKYGINLLQVVGQFSGPCIFIVAVMSVIPSSGLPIPQDYDQPVSATLSSDSEIIEGPSRVSLNCPISKRLIKMPVKGNFCKHYQCFDFSNYVEIMSKRPSWRCPSCNQTVCFTDLRVDQKMAKVLQEVGENVSEVIISVDGSWTAVSSDTHKDGSYNKTSANQQEGHELELSSASLDAGNMLDLTGEDDEMDIADQREPVDTKPAVHHNILSGPDDLALPQIFGSTTELAQYSSVQCSNNPSLGAGLYPGSAGFNIRPQANTGGTLGALTGNYGLTPVLTDANSPVLNREADNLQGTNYPVNSMGTPTNFPMPELYSRELLNSYLSTLRNARRDPTAIQALPAPAVQMPTNTQQHARPNVNFPTVSGSSAPFLGTLGSNARGSTPFNKNFERQRHHLQSHVRPLQGSNSSSHNYTAPPGISLSTQRQNMHMHQTLSQPPHLSKTPLPRQHPPQGVAPRVGVSNSMSTLQRVQLPPQASHGRQPQTMPLQTQAVRMPSSLPLNLVTPQVVHRPENLINLRSEHNWRPSSRMRGALTGEAYSQALNQYMGQGAQPGQTSSPRPSVSAASSMTPNYQVLLANRRIASEVQDQTVTNTATVSGTVGIQAEGSQGLN